MASFVLNTSSTTARTLVAGEDAIIGPNGSLSVLSGPAIFSTDAMDAFISGSVTAADGTAIDSFGTGAVRIQLSEGGSLQAGVNGVLVTASSGRVAAIENAGTIQGFSDGLQFRGSVSARVFNTGTIMAVEDAILKIGVGTISVNNAGNIFGNFGVEAFGAESAVQVYNMGIIQARFSAIQGGIADDIVINLGELIGNVLLRAGNDTFNGINGLQTRVDGGSGDDIILAGASSERLFGDFGNDRIFGNGGGDEIFGGSGNDIMRGGAEADQFNGGFDTDWVYYQNSTGSVEVDLTSGFGFGGHAEGDTYTRVENVYGTAGRDELNGSGVANYLVGGRGNDIMRGYGGNDQFRGDGGADVMNGGTGFDRLVYAASNGAVNVNLTLGAASGGHATGDIYFSMENVTGSDYGDRLTGSTGANHLIGLEGDDVLRGYLGNDLLNGGPGSDTFIFDNNGGSDIVADFQNDVDKLDLSAYNYASAAQVLANTTVSGADVFITFDANDVIRLVGFAANIGDLSDDLIL